MKEIRELLREVAENQSQQYNDDWEARAVSALNDWYSENNYDDHYIYDLTSDEWEEIVKYNLDSRGWLGVKYLLEDIDNTADYARLDGYGNGESVDYKLVELLQDVAGENN